MLLISNLHVGAVLRDPLGMRFCYPVVVIGQEYNSRYETKSGDDPLHFDFPSSKPH